MAVYSKELWFPERHFGEFTYSPDGEVFYTGADAEHAWREHHPEAAGLRPMPKIEDMAGKFLVVSQFCEPRQFRWNAERRDWDELRWTLQELGEEWWRSARPALYNHKEIQWGHSTWQVEKDGSLAFVGADYDSSD